MNKKIKVPNTQQIDFLQNLEFLVNNGEGFNYTVIKNKNCSKLRLWPNLLSTHGTALKNNKRYRRLNLKKTILLWNFCQQWQTARKQLRNNTEYVTRNNPLGPGLSGVWENIFHLFCSSASGKYNLLKYYWHENITTLNFYLIL